MIPDAGYRMRRMGPVLALCMVSLLMATAYSWEGARHAVTELTTDQLTMLTIAVRRDDPSALRGDMVVGHDGSEHYYLPMYVDLVRLFSGREQNYVLGLSRLLWATIIVFMLGWWWLYAKWLDGWSALAFAVVTRAVLPLPGGETWGVGGLWTMLPRTLFLAALPWGLRMWFANERKIVSRMAAYALIGGMVNFHPLSGLTVLVGMVAGDIVTRRIHPHRRSGDGWLLAAGPAIALVAAMPVFMFQRMGPGVDPAVFDLAAFRAALALRVPPDVLYPVRYLRQWLHPVLFLFVAIPLFWLMRFRAVACRRHPATVARLAGLAVGCVVAAAIPVLIQAVLQTVGYPVFSLTYMIRGLKFVIVPAFIGWALLLDGVQQRAARQRPCARRALPVLVLLAVMASLLLRVSPLASHPAVARSPVRFFWPESVGPGLAPVTAGQNDRIDDAIAWIRTETDPDARFVGPLVLRVAARRPVIHDHKGAAFLIENNPVAFLEWAERQRARQAVAASDPSGLPDLFRAWGADYWITRDRIKYSPVAYRDTTWTVYDLRPEARVVEPGTRGRAP